MVSLAKIRNIIKQYQNRNFRASVQKEKNQKYLFREPSPLNSRGKWSIFKKNGERISPLSRFIQDKIQLTEDIRKKQEYYLRYIGLFLISACVYILVYSPYFSISPSKVLIEGLDDGIDVSVAYRSIEDLYGENIFFIDEQDIAFALKKYQKNISIIRIERLYPNSLKVLLYSYPIIFDVTIAGINDKKWGMTENGVLVPKDRIEKNPEYTLTYIDGSLENDILLDYKELIPENESQMIKKTIDTFRETWPEYTIEQTYYLKRENELHIVLSNKTRILLTLQDFTKKTGEAQSYSHVRNQLLGLKSFIEKNKAAVKEGGYTYIDARILGKIFFCREQVQCLKNLATIYPDIPR